VTLVGWAWLALLASGAALALVMTVDVRRGTVGSGVVLGAFAALGGSLVFLAFAWMAATGDWHAP
jgi:hypothetical protein